MLLQQKGGGGGAGGGIGGGSGGGGGGGSVEAERKALEAKGASKSTGSNVGLGNGSQDFWHFLFVQFFGLHTITFVGLDRHGHCAICSGNPWQVFTTKPGKALRLKSH